MPIPNENVIPNVAAYTVMNADSTNTHLLICIDEAMLSELLTNRQAANVVSLATFTERDIKTLATSYRTCTLLVADDDNADLPLIDLLTLYIGKVTIGNWYHNTETGIEWKEYKDTLEWRYGRYVVNGYEMEEVLTLMAGHISYLADEFVAEVKCKEWAKTLKVSVSILQKQVKRLIGDRKEREASRLQEGTSGRGLPNGASLDDIYMYGFAEVLDREEIYNTGYYFPTLGDPVRKSNFVLTPLFHITGKDNNRRMIMVSNGVKDVIVDMPSNAMLSVEQFTAKLFDKGHYIFEGNRAHLLKIVHKVSDSFPECAEIKSFGWQKAGFWAFTNAAICNNTVQQYDEYGIILVDEKRYLSMPASSVEIGTAEDEDIYENDKYHTYVPTEVSFEKWAKLIYDVYGDNGAMGVAWAVMSAYRDLIFKVTKCPHMYAYGPVGSGKSEFGDSISALFFHKKPAFNLNQGTDYAFYSQLGRYMNCVLTQNEFDEYSIQDNWFRAIKGAYDGEGREKGRGGMEGKTRTQKVTSTLLLMGQYMSTRDDNSVLSRCIPLAFKEKGNRGQEEVKRFQQLKEWEEKGITGLLPEVIAYRKYIEHGYENAFSEQYKAYMEEFRKELKTPKTRIVKNITALVAMQAVLQKHLSFAVSQTSIVAMGKKMIIDMSNSVSSSSALAEWWKMVEYLTEKGVLEVSWDFKIMPETQVLLRVDGEKEWRSLEMDPVPVLYIRINAIQKLYSEWYRKQNGKNGINESTLELYLKDQDYYIGSSPAQIFKSKKIPGGAQKNTSCYVIDYTKLISAYQIDLDITQVEQPFGMNAYSAEKAF